MVAAANLVEVAALVGDTARATMLGALMDGRALTGSELAYLAQISRSTASEHLSKLVNARLVAVAKKRRYRYYRIASPLVARMLESIKAVAAIEVRPAINRVRCETSDCVSRVPVTTIGRPAGVALADALVAKKSVVLTADGGEVTDRRRTFLAAFGAELTPQSGSRRMFCRPCLDWSERRYQSRAAWAAEYGAVWSFIT